MAKLRPSFFYSLFFFAINYFISHTIAITKEQENDRIAVLPGQPPVNFSQFSGYVTVNETRGRALFYWLTEAKTNPHTKPIVLWLNGGPGCSSIGYGASEEIGPFQINKNGSSLRLNKYSWNKVANLLFLESPAGVGFSYTNTTSDLKTTSDERTAQDALVFLIRWFARFPQYNHRDFYLAGEGYSGHYIPQLAKKIIDYNKANPHKVINFKGFIAGNAYVDEYSNLLGIARYWWSHSIISDQTYEKLIRICKLNSTEKDFSPTKECEESFKYAKKHEVGNIDVYNIYGPTCIRSPSKDSNMDLKFKNSILTRRLFSSYDPCSKKYAEKYYNIPEVQKALHANITKMAYKWTNCSGVLFKNWKVSQDSVLPTLKELLATGLRIWFFSGDTDSVVSVIDTRLALKQLNLKIKTPWYPWYLDRQVGGWTEVYDGLTFATIRGAGHEVPRIQPKRAFRVFNSFLAGKKLPTVKIKNLNI